MVSSSSFKTWKVIGSLREWKVEGKKGGLLGPFILCSVKAGNGHRKQKVKNFSSGLYR